jgi:UDP-2-acetamido-3-amino-2,3-dideoxy-glucuronate N-acetyltransferase
VCIHCNCYVAQLCVVEDGAFIGPGTQLLNDRYPVRRDPTVWEPVTIKCGARIGGGVTILPGVTVGEDALIGGGAVVTKDVPAGEVWVGNPARRLYGAKCF